MTVPNPYQAPQTDCSTGPVEIRESRFRSFVRAFKAHLLTVTIASLLYGFVMMIIVLADPGTTYMAIAAGPAAALGSFIWGILLATLYGAPVTAILYRIGKGGYIASALLGALPGAVGRMLIPDSTLTVLAIWGMLVACGAWFFCKHWDMPESTTEEEAGTPTASDDRLSVKPESVVRGDKWS